MTGQVSDRVSYAPLAGPLRDEHAPREFLLAARAGGVLFDPAQIGLAVRMPHTGCRLGFHCDYAVRDGRLVLDALTCGLREADTKRVAAGDAPRVFGVALEPVYCDAQRYDPMTGALGPVERQPSGEFRAEGLAHPVEFTGGMLLGAEFVRELYVHGGTQSAWKYREVRELTFVRGALERDVDQSDAVARARAQLAGRDARSWWTRWFGEGREQSALAGVFAHRY